MKRNGFDPRGVMVASVTPFKDDESVDFDRLASHIDDMLGAGIEGVMLIGGSGEYVNLTMEERRRIVLEGAKAVDGRGPVVVGALAPSTREVVEVGSFAAEVGATALLVAPPYYIKPSFEGVMNHYETVARETGLNVIVYNIPGRTGWPLELPHLRELCAMESVVAVKECERDVAQISLKITALSDIAFMSGDDDLGFATILSGGRGAIWASPNLNPKLAVELYAASAAKDVDRALPLHNRMVNLFWKWFMPNHPGPLKEAMAMVGRPVGPARSPLAKMTADQRAALEEAIQTFGPVE